MLIIMFLEYMPCIFLFEIPAVFLRSLTLFQPSIYVYWLYFPFNSRNGHSFSETARGFDLDLKKKETC